MPKSKRSRVVHLTKTQPKGQARKSELMDTVQKCCDEYKCIYVFSCKNMRSDPLKRLRAEAKTSRFLYGKSKVIQKALGKNSEEAYLPGLNKVAEVLRGEVGLIFTNEKPSEFEKLLEGFRETDFARAGFRAGETITATKGPIVGQPSSMYEPLRRMMLPVKLNKGVVELEEDHVLCTKGDLLTAEQAQALKFFNHKLAEFQVLLQYRWRDGELIKLAEDAEEAPAAKMEEEKDGEDEDEEDF